MRARVGVIVHCFSVAGRGARSSARVSRLRSLDEYAIERSCVALYPDNIDKLLCIK